MRRTFETAIKWLENRNDLPLHHLRKDVYEYPEEFDLESKPVIKDKQEYGYCVKIHSLLESLKFSEYNNTGQDRYEYIAGIQDLYLKAARKYNDQFLVKDPDLKVKLRYMIWDKEIKDLPKIDFFWSLVESGNIHKKKYENNRMELYVTGLDFKTLESTEYRNGKWSSIRLSRVDLQAIQIVLLPEQKLEILVDSRFSMIPELDSRFTTVMIDNSINCIPPIRFTNKEKQLLSLL